jgi:RHS repeat-associated protein
LDRLTSATNSAVTQGWTYDSNGNRLSETGSTPSTYTYASGPNSNRLAAITGNLPRTYGYDAAGNTLGYSGVVFTYNNRGRMASATYSGNSATYTYNALGQRVKRAASTGTTLYMYDEAGHLVGEYDIAGALIQETVWFGDTPVATLRPNGGSGIDVFYVHADNLNTPRLVTQPSNNAERWRWDSDPFGTTVPNENPATLGVFKYNLRFPGQQYDGIAGLFYNYFRDYDSAIGRYVESDPIGLRGGLNTYSYVSENPIWAVDPFGLDETFWGGPGRSRFDGPANGNWGGQNWSGGQAPRSNGGFPGSKPPMDSADRCYMAHDSCYTACRARYGARAGQLCLPIVCHRQLKKCLNDLGNECSKWPEPPRVGTEEDTLNYRRQALNWFSTNRQDGSKPPSAPPEFTPYIDNDKTPPSDFLNRN